MNARRLAATETNIAYRTADHERWKKMDFVVGIEIHLSNNHNCKGIPKGMFHDICDDLKGRYPKDFKFTGWHPHCRCYATSVLKTDDEIAEDTKRILRGEKPTEGSENEVKDVPDGFKDWIQNNEQRVKYHTTVPYFLKDNPKFVPESFISGIGTLSRRSDAGLVNDFREALLKLKDPTFITEREVKDMVENFAKSNATLFVGGLSGVKITRAKSVDYMMANERGYDKKTGKYDGKGNTIKIANKDVAVQGKVFSPLHELKSAMKAIAEKRAMTFDEEYALECLWHEIRHAAAQGWSDVNKKTPELSMVMETVNQFCARRSYGQLVKSLGGKLYNKKEILENGYGYQRWVSNFGKILKRCNISQSSAHAYLKDKILTTPYEDMREVVVEMLVNRSGIKRQSVEDMLTGLVLSDKAFDTVLKGV